VRRSFGASKALSKRRAGSMGLGGAQPLEFKN